MNVKLVQDMVLFAEGRQRKRSRSIAHLEHTNRAIRPRSTESWDRGSLLIPAVCPSSLQFTSCRILGISYRVVFSYGASRSIDHEIAFPITIGSLPFRENNDLKSGDISHEQVPLLVSTGDLAHNNNWMSELDSKSN
jgi:hypothetical protein